MFSGIASTIALLAALMSPSGAPPLVDPCYNGAGDGGMPDPGNLQPKLPLTWCPGCKCIRDKNGDCVWLAPMR